MEFREVDPGGRVEPKFYRIQAASSYKPPTDKHVWVGMFTRKRKQGTKEDCLTTGVIWADYDGIPLDQVKANIRKAGIPAASMIVSSGNGFHAYWILSKRIGHEAEQITKAICKLTESDSQSTDIARHMRLPGSFNLKGGEKKACYVVESNEWTYPPETIKKAVESAIMTPERHSREYATTGKPCIDKMLAGVGKGQRNFALGRITKQLQLMGFQKATAKEQILAFNQRCTPPKTQNEVITDFNAIWESDYKLLGCKIDDTRLQAILSEFCDPESCKLSNQKAFVELGNSVDFNNRTVFKRYDGLSGNDLVVLGIIKKYPQGLHRERLEQSLFSPGTQSYFVESRTLRKILDKLRGLGFIEFIDSQKSRSKNTKGYFVKAMEQATYGAGFTLISNGAIMGAVDKRITPNQFKLYALLLKYAHGKGESNPGTNTLAEEMGSSQPRVYAELKCLQAAGYVEIYCQYPNGHKKLYYRLLI